MEKRTYGVIALHVGLEEFLTLRFGRHVIEYDPSVADSGRRSCYIFFHGPSWWLRENIAIELP